ncbi:hypothetical protein [Clostridium perfringens]|uniref:hypothetical protein n=1 Tax=Clostridium perfringens TaxID=1502 RepID=UPI0030CA7C1D
MFTINNFAFDSIKKLDELKLYNCLDIRSYKKNRKVIIEKIEFPRSNKLRVYVLETKDQSACRANYRDESISEDEEEKLSIFIETSYSSYEAIKSLIESSNDLIIEVNFAQNVTIKSKVSTETYLTLKNYLKDRQDTNIFAY